MRRTYCYKFRTWRLFNLRPIFSLDGVGVSDVCGVGSLNGLTLGSGDRMLVWGPRAPDEVVQLGRASGARILQVEDGFIRSVGLGSDLIRPQSVVLDGRGIYFDAARPSDLEVLLNEQAFTPDELSEALAVREFIVAHGITKYNLEPNEPIDFSGLAGDRPVVLVPGQVEDDASIALGCTGIHTNLQLLEAVRAARPHAFIVYKPHPDVVSGNRKGRLAASAARQYADWVETKASVVSCIAACDELHTMTSLSGFDALLRGKPVVTYGQPFYAGWGLTEDRCQDGPAFARRTRRLSLDELVVGALLKYPIYWDWDLKGYTTCMAVLHRIVEERSALEANGGLNKLRVGWLRRQWRKVGVLVRAYGLGVG